MAKHESDHQSTQLNLLLWGPLLQMLNYLQDQGAQCSSRQNFKGLRSEKRLNLSPNRLETGDLNDCEKLVAIMSHTATT